MINQAREALKLARELLAHSASFQERFDALRVIDVAMESLSEPTINARNILLSHRLQAVREYSTPPGTNSLPQPALETLDECINALRFQK